MLKKRNLAVWVCLLFAGSLSADFTAEFQSASLLAKKRQYSEAAAAYEKLGREQKNAKRSDLCFLYASKVLAAGRKFEESLEAAKRIQDPCLQEYARMNAHNACGKLALLRQNFKDTDISKWPDQYAYLGFFMRGNAALGTAGIEDMEKALAGVGSDWQVRDAVRRNLAEKYMEKGENAKAHAVLDDLIRTGIKNTLPVLGGIRMKALLLAREKKFEEAEKVLETIDRKGNWKEPNQHFWFVITQAKIELEKGNSAAAEKLFDEAFAMDKIPAPVIRLQKMEAGRKISKFKEKRK